MATCRSRKGFRPGAAPSQVVLDGGPKKPSVSYYFDCAGNLSTPPVGSIGFFW